MKNRYIMIEKVIRDSKMKIHDDGTHQNILELKSNSNKTTLITGFDEFDNEVFLVDEGGNLNATSKSFLINHPQKEGYALRHGSLEGPEHGVYVRGILKNNNTIELPDYWSELIDESTITVQLTSIGKHQNLYVKDIMNNKVIVGNSNVLGGKINCYYFIQAERKDIEKMVTEFKTGV